MHLEKAVEAFLAGTNRTRISPAHESPDSARFLAALQASLDAVERRDRWRRVIHALKTCASHLVIEGDEDA